MMAFQNICKQYSHCLSCPLALGSVECYKLSQQEVNDIMTITRILEAKPDQYRVTKEDMAEMVKLVRAADGNIVFEELHAKSTK